MMQWNPLVIEDYVSTEEKINNSLVAITNFINKSHLPFAGNENQLKRDCLIAEIALTRFSQLEEKVENPFFFIAKQLCEKSHLQCYDEPTLIFYHHIVNIWGRSIYIKQAIGTLCIFLTPARYTISLSEKLLDQAECLINFVLKHFKWLEEETQRHIHHLSQLTKIPPLPDLLKEPNCTLYELLLKVFDQFTEANLSTQSTPVMRSSSSFKNDSSQIPKSNNFKQMVKNVVTLQLTVEKFEKDCCIVPFPNELSSKEQINIENYFQKKRDQEERIEKAQIQKICQLSLHFFEHYFPFQMGINQRQQFLKECDQRLPHIVKELFFIDPAPVSRVQFQILIHCLQQLSEFLKLINKQQLASIEMSQEDLHQQLVTIVEQIFILLPKETSRLNSFLSFISATPCVSLIDYLLNPDAFCLFMERLLSSELWDWEDFNDKKIPQDLFPTNDKSTKQLGLVLETLGQELIILGQPTWSMNVLSKGLISVISIKKFELAQKMQQMLHQIKSTHCSMTPLLVLHRIFFRKENDAFVPTWYKWKELTDEQKKNQRSSFEIILNDRLHQLIQSEVEKQSQIGRWILDHTSSVKTFCNTLSQRLWHMLQEEKSIKLLLIYLLKGIQKGLSSEKNNRS